MAWMDPADPLPDAMDLDRRDSTLYARLSRLGAGPRSPEVVRMLVEIPKGSCNKYEIDEDTGLIRLDRNLSTSNVYPGDYGFIPGTLSEDGDPLDVLVAVNEPTFSGCLIDARVVGVFHMIDGGLADEKIIAVPNRDPHFAEVTDLDHLPAHFQRHLAHFFCTYKALEDGVTEARGFGGVGDARATVLQAVARHQRKAEIERAATTAA